MALTEKLDIPNRPEERVKWSARFLFPARAMASALTKVFVTPFDFLLGLLVLAIVVVEVASDGSWMLYMFSTLVLAADVFERHFNNAAPKEEKPKE
jgi:hypothetical protein